MGKKKKPSRGKVNKEHVNQKTESKGEAVKWITELKNDNFEKYYMAQKLFAEEDWSTFMEALREPLPTTFRLAGSREAKYELNDIICTTYVPLLTNVVFEDKVVPPPVQIPWYPEGLAWQLNVPKAVVRRLPEFKRFHNFLVYETDMGNISRQEAVSMIPPLLLDVQPHHIVLDMCAAPGSKTAQLLEAMHAPSADDTTSIPPGLLIANDGDSRRTHLLVHQSSRLPSLCLLVTNLDASNFPNIALAPPSSPDTGSVASGPLKYDRILCDVPCSGDGTLRKNLAIWNHWQPMDANGLHSLQLRILLRAMKLLKSTGRIVYSTCSLNPVENEAVVAAALNASPDFELVDVSSSLPDLMRKPGLEQWSPVVDKDLTAHATFTAFFDECQSKNKKQQPNQLKMAETHWPPRNVADLNLTRCMRIYPHLQDMGGFFVAVLRRKSAVQDLTHKNGKRPVLETLDASSVPLAKKIKVGEQSNVAYASEIDEDNVLLQESPKVSGRQGDVEDSLIDIPLESFTSSTSAKEEISVSVKKKKVKGKEKDEDSHGKFKEPPYTFIEPNHPQLLETLNRFNVTDSFPSSNVFVRHPDGGAATVPLRSMYLCNELVKRVILANDYTRIRLVSAGTKIFTRQDAGGIRTEGAKTDIQQQFRLLNDTVSIVLPYIPKETILTGGLKELRILLENYYPLLECFDEPFRSTVGEKENGNYLVRFDAAEWNGATLSHSIVLPLWKSNASMSLMADKKSKSSLSLRIFGEDITVAGRQLLEQQKKNQERRNAAKIAQARQGGSTDNEASETGSE